MGHIYPAARADGDEVDASSGASSRAPSTSKRSLMKCATPTWAGAWALNVAHALLQGSVILYMSGPETLAYNITLDRAFNESDPLQSVLLSVPEFINSSAATLGVLYGANATAKPQVVRAFPSQTWLIPVLLGLKTPLMVAWSPERCSMDAKPRLAQ